jgi:hypothetical protein
MGQRPDLTLLDPGSPLRDEAFHGEQLVAKGHIKFQDLNIPTSRFRGSRILSGSDPKVLRLPFSETAPPGCSLSQKKCLVPAKLELALPALHVRQTNPLPTCSVTSNLSPGVLHRTGAG